MDPVILYGSRYGNARRYAEVLGEREGIPVLPFRQAADLNRFDTILYIGSLYAGRVTGLSKTMRRKDCAGKRIIILTVGLADGEKEKNAVNIPVSYTHLDVYKRQASFRDSTADRPCFLSRTVKRSDRYGGTGRMCSACLLYTSRCV